MAGGGGADDGDSLDSDSEDLILDGATNGEDTDDDELEVNEMAAESLKNRKSAKIKAAAAAAGGSVPGGAVMESDDDDEF